MNSGFPSDWPSVKADFIQSAPPGRCSENLRKQTTVLCEALFEFDKQLSWGKQFGFKPWIPLYENYTFVEAYNQVDGKRASSNLADMIGGLCFEMDPTTAPLRTAIQKLPAPPTEKQKSPANDVTSRGLFHSSQRTHYSFSLKEGPSGAILYGLDEIPPEYEWKKYLFPLIPHGNNLPTVDGVLKVFEEMCLKKGFLPAAATDPQIPVAAPDGGKPVLKLVQPPPRF